MAASLKSVVSACAAALLLASPALAEQPRSLQHAEAFRAAAPAAAASPLRQVLDAARGRTTDKAIKQTLNYPYGITLDAAGNLYAANLFAGVTVYNTKLQYQGAITAGMAVPAAVGVNFEGNIFVANNESGAITVYNPQWQQIGTIADPNLTSPACLYVDPDDSIWVLDGEGAVHAYLADYTPLPVAATGGGTALGPWGPNMTVWGIPSSTGGFIEDVGNRGEMVRNNPSFPTFFPSGSPLAGGETEDSAGQQYVTDYANHQVDIWSSSAEFMTGVINTPSAPTGIAVDSTRNRIYVALPEASEIIVYSRLPPFKQLAVIH